MADWLVKLYTLDYSGMPDREEAVLKEQGIRIVRLLSPNFESMQNFIRKEFGNGWASEVTAAFYRSPVACFAAVNAQREPVGFACYDATALGFFGPTGVKKELRGKGIGTLLLYRCLHSMKEIGYVYAIIGSSKNEFYRKVVNAEPIPDSAPGVYSQSF